MASIPRHHGVWVIPCGYRDPGKVRELRARYGAISHRRGSQDWLCVGLPGLGKRSTAFQHLHWLPSGAREAAHRFFGGFMIGRNGEEPGKGDHIEQEF